MLHIISCFKIPRNKPTVIIILHNFSILFLSIFIVYRSTFLQDRKQAFWNVFHNIDVSIEAVITVWNLVVVKAIVTDVAVRTGGADAKPV